MTFAYQTFAFTVTEILNWPLVGLILGLVIIFVFRPSINNLFGRIRSVTRHGFEAGPPGQQAAGEDKNRSAAAELLKVFDNALLLKNEESILQDLHERKITGQEEREKILTRFLAASYLELFFERAYTAIFGSQLGTLQVLNASEPTGLSTDAMRAFYDMAASTEPEIYQSYSFEQWLSFLRTWNLVLVEPERVRISLEGREFLRFLMQKGYSLYKRG
jgi:hypothetical protein